MDFQKYFEYKNYNFIIPVNEIMKLNERELGSLYAENDESTKFNVYFILLNEYHYLEQSNNFEESAHVCYLISYYLFHLLTPPASEELAMIYAQKARTIHDIPKYHEWIEEVEKGN